ncbi:MAG: hypothetical protein MUO24_04750 [Desulfobacterales bacterium]|nr:hypothetical protein [Desulfobacterales bacterium]
MYCYIVGRDRVGKPYIRGPYTSVLVAERVNDAADYPGELVTLKTADPNRATRILKERRIRRVGLDEGMKKFRHPDGKKRKRGPGRRGSA